MISYNNGFSHNPSAVFSLYLNMILLFCRPILVRFVLWKDRSRMFYKRKNLPKEMSLEEDLTTQQKKGRKTLETFAKSATREGKNVKWNAGRLYVNGKEVKFENVPKEYRTD